jgi:hypothetical protein
MQRYGTQAVAFSNRCAVKPSRIDQTCSARVNVPPQLKSSILNALRGVDGVSHIVDLCDDARVHCPAAQIVGLQKADSIPLEVRRLGVPVAGEAKIIVPATHWTYDQMTVYLHGDPMSDDEGVEDSPDSAAPVLCEIEFDAACSFMEVACAGGDDPIVVSLSEAPGADDCSCADASTRGVSPEDTRSAITSALDAVCLAGGPEVKLLESPDSMDVAELAYTRPNGISMFSLPPWFVNLSTMWLANVRRLHVLCNSRLPPGVNRPFCLDGALVSSFSPSRKTTLRMELHCSTCSCLCLQPLQGRSLVVFEIRFCGMCSTGTCVQHPTSRAANPMFCTPTTDGSAPKAICMDGLEMYASCCHPGCTPDSRNRRIDLLRGCRETDPFLTTACGIAALLAARHSLPDATDWLLDAYTNSIVRHERICSLSYEEMLLRDMVTEELIRSGTIYVKQNRITKALEFASRDGTSVSTFFKTMGSTHLHLLP